MTLANSQNRHGGGAFQMISATIATTCQTFISAQSEQGDCE